jgi:hypothetical protein
MQITLHRSAIGLSVHVKTHPAIEDFMRSLGDGLVKPVEIYGKSWISMPGSERSLEIYNMDRSLPYDMYRLDIAGRPMEQEGQLNMSFLRLAGTSEGNGVTFGVKGVYSLESLRNLRDKISASARQLYIEYLRPVDLTVTVSTQEMAG